MILLSNDMFDYIVRLLGWAVEGGTKVSQHPVGMEKGIFSYRIHEDSLKILEMRAI